jgi:hypothetical protein
MAAALSAGYPQTSDRLPARLRASRLAADMPLRCVSVLTQSVFDTHNSQVATLNAGLEEAAQTLYAFQRDLEALGRLTACSCSCDRSSAIARGRTPRAAPTTGRRAARS